MQVGAIVQARFSSKRLPGKVLRPLCGKPLLAHLIDRLRRSGALDVIAVATSTEQSDDAVAAFCTDAGVACHRGPLDDVLARIQDAARHLTLDGIVRISGDSPLLDPALVRQAVKLFRRGGWDVVTNVQVRSFPKGQSVEIIAANALDQAAKKARKPAEREHVTPFLYAHPELFRIRNLVARVPRPMLQLSVDTADDFEFIETILTAAGARAERLDLDETIELAELLGPETAG
jgi:spore coat polysaccharide biosynthesis protein SpsF (cytidylyltransferase family)